MTCVADRIHALRIPFTLPLGPEKTLERFVYVFMVYGEVITLIDTGISTSVAAIEEYIASTGRSFDDIRLAILTHAHPDHLGGARIIVERCGCKIAAHIDSVRWTEDTALQFSERPVPGFNEIVAGGVKVDTILADGGRIDLPGAGTLTVIETPGHARGHIALFHEAAGALFTGDAIPMPGEMPIYADARAVVASLRKLQEIQGVTMLLSSWDEPRFGAETARAIDEGIAWMHCMHETVMEVRAAAESPDIAAIAGTVVDRLSLPGYTLNPLFMKAVASHLTAGPAL